MNLLKVCDHKLRIRYISSHYPGSVHDSLVWNASELKQILKDNFLMAIKILGCWARQIEFIKNLKQKLLSLIFQGDAGYPLEPYLITPFRLAGEGTPQCKFNYIHSQTRNVVERTIGVLKNRFRCLLGARQLHYLPKTASKITNVCAALHNICIAYKMEMPETNDGNDSTEDWNIEGNEDLTASNIREKLMQAMNL